MIRDKFIYVSQNILRRHEVEMVHVRRHANRVFGKFFTQNTAVKILDRLGCQYRG